MPRITSAVAVGAFVVVVLVNAGCKECTCKSYTAETAQATYCRYHRNAVWDYVEQAAGDTNAMKAQYERLKSLLEAVKDCDDVPCIEKQIQADSLAPAFAGLFASANSEGEQEVGTTQFDRAQVVLCGLRHGLVDWHDSLRIEEEL
ncbi:MAG TPA: hypothetical protein VN285_03675 [Candidatus Deferrimicrobium sp.]|nr:hypothetical protein [Candidatus Deferrimicrobium sp.]